MPGNSQPCQSLYRNPSGSGQPAGLAAAGLFLPESEIHPEALARSANPCSKQTATAQDRTMTTSAARTITIRLPTSFYSKAPSGEQC